MQRVIKSILSLCLAVAVCISTATFSGVAKYTVADAATVDSYYSGITATSGTSLLGQLHDLIVETHKTYTTYDDCKSSKVNQTDPGPNGVGVLDFYTQTNVTQFSGTVGTWNREHVWAQSLSNNLWGTSGGGSDMHHIRPSEAKINSNRGNKTFGEVGSSGKEEWSYNTSGNTVALGGHSNSSTFEPLDNIKGDVARIVMYVYTHYNNASNVGGTKESAKTHGNLPFTNIITASNETAAKTLLLKWNKLDPVDDIERTRNEAVYTIQGNRNPFIDNSDYANAIWGDGSSTIDPQPSGTLQSISLSATALNLSVGDTHTLTVTPNPSNASASVNWTSSDNEVATVSGGKITANSTGTATITATSTVNSSIKATATVTVRQTSSTETTTGKITISRDSFPNASGGYGVQSWSTGGVSGTAYAYGGNKTAIQFNTSKDSQYIASSTPTCGAIKKVTVNLTGNSDWTLLTSAQPYGETSSGNPTEGNSHTEDASGSCTWTVSGDDRYFALVLGGSGASYVDSIEVEYGTSGSTVTPDELQELLINPSEFSLKEGEGTELSVVSVPSTASAEVSWTSSDNGVATVSADGKVTAVKAGTATITATSTVNSSIKATATVTVVSEQAKEDSQEVKAFRQAVAAIDDDGTLDAWRTSINSAVKAYGKLPVDDIASVSDEIETLRSAIANYNEKIKSYNDAADDADNTALNVAHKFH